MTPRYLTASAVARSLGIGPRRLRTLLAAGRIPGAYKLKGWDYTGCRQQICYCHMDESIKACSSCGCRSCGSTWIIPADYTLTPGRRGPQPNWRKA